MARARRGFKARRRRNKIFKLAKGYHFDRRTKYRHTVQTVVRALHYSYIGRKLLKRNMRRLWIQRISAGAKTLGTSYSKFMDTLKKSDVKLNRKMLSEIAATDFNSFKAIQEAAAK
ncbi:MAG: 50S ribosomal protein L20 [Bacteriovoracaceae bacterium]